MLDSLKKILNEDQDPKAIEKITSKLQNLMMSNEEVGYIAVQKKPAVNLLPDAIVATNKRLLVCKPKNLGLSMEFVDFDWKDVKACFIKEGILGAEFTFTTQTDLTQTMDYLPKNQARKLYTFTKEQLEASKNTPEATHIPPSIEITSEEPLVESTFLEAEIITPEVEEINPVATENSFLNNEAPLQSLSKDELFAKLQNYKKLLDNGLILQGEYDAMKNEILKYL